MLFSPARAPKKRLSFIWLEKLEFSGMASSIKIPIRGDVFQAETKSFRCRRLVDVALSCINDLAITAFEFEATRQTHQIEGEQSP